MLERRLRRWWDEELAPTFAGLAPVPSYIAILGTTLLINKRYLSDGAFGGLPVTRWLGLVGWLLACLLLVTVRRRRPDSVGAALGAAAAGAGVMVLALSFSHTPGQPWQFARPWTLAGGDTLRAHDAMVMQLLVWLAVAPAIAVARPAEARPALAWWPVTVALTLAATMLLGRGPCRLVLWDTRYDKLNWCLLTFCWLGCGGVGLTWLHLGCGADAPPRDGLALGRWRWWLPWCVFMLAVMWTLVLGYAGRQPGFVQYYPMFKEDWPGYNPWRDGWGFLAAYEVAFGLYFLAWEWFFRGWMLFRLERYCGAQAILWQCVPFVLMHIGKPGPELHSSLVAGLVLGWLAWRGRSIWPCFLVHWGAAATMDLVGLFRGLTGQH